MNPNTLLVHYWNFDFNKMQGTEILTTKNCCNTLEPLHVMSLRLSKINVKLWVYGFNGFRPVVKF